MNNLIFIPTIQEAKSLFPDTKFTVWELGIFRAKYKQYELFVTGIGKTNIAFSSTFIFSKLKNIKTVILIGIAGAYRNSGLKIGDIISVERDFFVDEALFNKNELTMTSEIGFSICENNAVNFSSFSMLEAVNANTVSLLSADDLMANLYQKKTGALIETMEGASFGLISAKMAVKAYQVRGISNYCGDRNKQEWDIKKAINSLKNFLKKI
jgi:futalosine hydrolase